MILIKFGLPTTPESMCSATINFLIIFCKEVALEPHKNTWQELYSNRRKLRFYTVMESILHECYASFHAPRWNTSDAIVVFVRACTQPFHFLAIIAQLYLLWGPWQTTCGFYWRFPMMLVMFSTLEMDVGVFEGQPTPKNWHLVANFLMKMRIFWLEKLFYWVKMVQF